MALLGRIVVILFALWIATMAAGIVWSIGLLGSQWPAMSGDVGDRVVFWGAAFIASGITATLLFLPMLIAVVLAEAFSLRSILIYAVGGAALFLLAYQGAGFGRSYEESIDRAPPPVSREFQIAAGSGIAFGFIYWLIAGRKAGRWRERV
jgi:NADPH:quinone reductase-like Zn-dependent oxidoreductase